MQELSVQHSISIASNLDDVQASIESTIAKYDVVVTEDALPEAKELMATFNKQKKQFSDQCKAFLSAISTPIDEFKARQKAIEKLFDDGRAKIEQQVKAFESHKLEAIKVLLKQYRDNACSEKGIDPASIVVDDLVKLTAANSNKTGYSVAKATAEIITMRIQTVENEILRAKLAAEEAAKRDREIAEQARIEAEERARQREAELLAKAERDKAEAVAQATRQAQQQAPQQIPTEAPQQATQLTGDKCEFTVTVTLKISTPRPVSADKVKSAVMDKFEKAGFSTIQQVNVA